MLHSKVTFKSITGPDDTCQVLISRHRLIKTELLNASSQEVLFSQVHVFYLSSRSQVDL